MRPNRLPGHQTTGGPVSSAGLARDSFPSRPVFPMLISRRRLLAAAPFALAATAGCGRGRHVARALTRSGPMPDAPDLVSDLVPQSRTPVLFVGHGSPMNAIEDSTWSRGF